MLLRVLVLVVGGIVGAVVLLATLLLGIVAALSVASLAAPLLLRGCSSSSVPCTAVSPTVTAAAIASLGWSIPAAALLLVSGWNVALPDLGATPRRDVRTSCGNVMTGPCPSQPPRFHSRGLSSLSELSHEASVLRVEPTLDHGRLRSVDGVRIPVNGTVACHVSGTPADAADDVSGEVSLFGAVILAVTHATAILTDLVLVVTKGTVERGELAELVTFMIVLTFWRRGSLKAT